MTEQPEKDCGAVTHPLPTGIIVDRSVRVLMRDGVHLVVSLFRSASDGQFPVILCVTVYEKDFGPADYSTLKKIKDGGNEVGTLSISDATTWEGPDPGFWVPNATQSSSRTHAATTTLKASQGYNRTLMQKTSPS